MAPTQMLMPGLRLLSSRHVLAWLAAGSTLLHRRDPSVLDEGPHARARRHGGAQGPGLNKAT
jgi:hypothetical protein